MKYSKVIGVGHYLPENVVTNEDIMKTVDTTDEWITERIKQALELVDIRLLDHFIIGNAEITSFAEIGLLS